MTVIGSFFKKTVAAVALAVFTVTATVASPLPEAASSTEHTDSVNRAVAVVMAGSLTPIINNLQSAGLPVTPERVGYFLAQTLAGKDSGMTVADANAYVDSLLRGGAPQVPDTVSTQSQAEFLADMAKLPGAIVTPSGLVFQVMVEGEGVSPTFTDRVNVKYVGRFSDGTVFDDTGDEVVTFDLGSEIPGFVEGLRMMKPGGTYRLAVPAELAYGKEGIPGIIPGNAALEFIVTLESVTPAEH